MKTVHNFLYTPENSLKYFYLRDKWDKYLNSSILLNRFDKNLYTNIKINSNEEDFFFKKFKRNLLWNFYKNYRPKIMSDTFIRTLEAKIKTLKIKLNFTDLEIMNSLRTEAFNSYRILKKLPAPKNSINSKWIYYQIENCNLYQIPKINSKNKQIENYYKNTKIIIQGLLYFGTRSFIFENPDNNKIIEFKYSEIEYLKCFNNYIIIEVNGESYTVNIYLDNVNLFKLGIIRLKLRKKINKPE